jgi:spermidine synthase
VIRVAREDFTFLTDSPADITVVEGDGRLALEREPGSSFDILVLDAFTGDSVPVHLLTREAFALYFAKLKPDGILAVHVTNLYLDLAPVVRALAASYQREARLVRSRSDATRQVEAADWVLIARSAGALDRMPVPFTAIANRPGTRVWTDDYSNLFTILR